MATFDECQKIQEALKDPKCNDQTQNINQECENHIKGVLDQDKTHDIKQSINRCKTMCNKYSKYNQFKKPICDLIAKIKDSQKSIESKTLVERGNELKKTIKGRHHFFYDRHSNSLHPFSNYFYKNHKSDIKTFFKLFNDNDNVNDNVNVNDNDKNYKNNIISMKATYYTSSTSTYHLKKMEAIENSLEKNNVLLFKQYANRFRHTKCHQKGAVLKESNPKLICKKSKKPRMFDPCKGKMCWHRKGPGDSVMYYFSIKAAKKKEKQKFKTKKNTNISGGAYKYKKLKKSRNNEKSKKGNRSKKSNKSKSNKKSKNQK